MTNSTARFVLIIAGALALLVGLVFTGQGANLIPGSLMTGDPTWLVVGVVLAMVGVVLLVVALRGPRRS